MRLLTAAIRGARARQNARHTLFVSNYRTTWNAGRDGKCHAEIPARRNQETEAHGNQSASGRPAKPSRSFGCSARRQPKIGENRPKRAEEEVRIADARKSHERLREAIDILAAGHRVSEAEGRTPLDKT